MKKMNPKVSSIDIEFSKIVRLKRKHRADKSNFKSTDMSFFLKMSRKNYSRKETNKTPWSLREAVETCKILGIEEIKIGAL
jgi:hypothetical protein